MKHLKSYRIFENVSLFEDHEEITNILQNFLYSEFDYDIKVMPCCISIESNEPSCPSCDSSSVSSFNDLESGKTFWNCADCEYEGTVEEFGVGDYLTVVHTSVKENQNAYSTFNSDAETFSKIYNTLNIISEAQIYRLNFILEPFDLKFWRIKNNDLIYSFIMNPDVLAGVIDMSDNLLTKIEVGKNNL